MSLVTPLKVGILQQALHVKAKEEPEFRFYQLYDKVYRWDVLVHAYRLCRANAGAPGVDGLSFDKIESRGLRKWLEELAVDLRTKTYNADPVRRVWIPKVNDKERPLGIPTVRDRVVQRRWYWFSNPYSRPTAVSTNKHPFSSYGNVMYRRPRALPVAPFRLFHT